MLIPAPWKAGSWRLMIEGKVADEDAYVGRTYMDSPDVDGLIFVNTDLSLMSGDFVRVRVTGAHGLRSDWGGRG